MNVNLTALLKSTTNAQVSYVSGVRSLTVTGNAPIITPVSGDGAYASWGQAFTINGSTIWLAYVAVSEDDGKDIVRIRSMGTDGKTPGTPWTVLLGSEYYDAQGRFGQVLGYESESDTLWMIYLGMESAYSIYHICLARLQNASTAMVANAQFEKLGPIITSSEIARWGGFGIEPTGLMRVGSTYYLYGTSLPGGLSPDGWKNDDRRGYVCVNDSGSMTNWTTKKFHPLLCSTESIAKAQPFKYFISPHVFRVSSSRFENYYMFATTGGNNTNNQQLDLFSSNTPLFKRHETTFLGTWQTTGPGSVFNAELDIVSLLSTNIYCTQRPSGTVKFYYGARSYTQFGAQWSLALAEETSMETFLTCPLQTPSMRHFSTWFSENPTPDLPVISGQPGNRTVTAGQQTTFTVTGTGIDYYRWQVSPDNSEWTWEDISGATSASYVLTTSAGDNQKRYRCWVGNEGGTFASSVARLTVS